MGKISVIFRDSPCNRRSESLRRGEITEDTVCGREIVRVRLIRGGRRYVRRLFQKHQIDSAVLRGDIPAYVTELAEEFGIKVHTGKKLLHSVLPYLISRAAKENPLCESCTVYSASADGECMEIIKLAAEKFRHVSLCCDGEIYGSFARSIMDDTGLALKIGRIDGSVAILCSGNGDGHDVRINLNDATSVVFADKNKKILSAAMVEAIAGEGADKKTLDGLGLKIYKRLDKTKTLY